MKSSGDCSASVLAGFGKQSVGVKGGASGGDIFAKMKGLVT